MPTVLRMDGYRFFFFSDEHLPEHIHIEKAECYVRMELETLRVTESYRCNPKEINKLRSLVEKHREHFIEAWRRYFEA